MHHLQRGCPPLDVRAKLGLPGEVQREVRAQAAFLWHGIDEVPEGRPACLGAEPCTDQDNPSSTCGCRHRGTGSPFSPGPDRCCCTRAAHMFTTRARDSNL